MKNKPPSRSRTPAPVHPERSRGSALTPWLTAVDRAVRSIPRGQTASYARVALMAGKPGAARAVVQALHRLEGLPWWRVLRSDGTLAPQVAGEQATRLAKEGVRLRRAGKRVSLAPSAERPRLPRG